MLEKAKKIVYFCKSFLPLSGDGFPPVHHRYTTGTLPVLYRYFTET